MALPVLRPAKMEDSKLWIGGLQKALPSSSLQSWLESAGCHGIVRVRMFHKQVGKSSAIVSFSDAGAAKFAHDLIAASSAEWGTSVRFAWKNDVAKPPPPPPPPLPGRSSSSSGQVPVATHKVCHDFRHTPCLRNA